MLNQTQIDSSIKFTKWGFLFLGTAWVAFGVYHVFRVTGAGTGFSGYSWVVAGLMLVNGGVLLWIGMELRKAKRSYFFLAILLLASNILLTITDQFGIFDLVTLLIAFVLLVLLLYKRSWYISVQ